MLIFHLKKEWFDKVKSGEKTHEYRICNKYWTERITKIQKRFEQRKTRIDITKQYPTEVVIVFARGYPSYDDFDMYVSAIIKNISIIDGKDTDLKYDGKVFDIEFELINNRQL